MGEPQVTVLMPVYNGEPYLRAAIDSILNQSFTDFEFLIINDGSTDQSLKTIKSCKDRRIRLVNQRSNQGLIATLNRGFAVAKGRLIARMDCDDISMPERLSKQVAFMEEHPEVGVCGSWIEYFMGKELVMNFPVSHEEIVQAMPYFNPMAHPTLVIRREVLQTQSVLFDAAYPHVEDYELWTRLAQVTRFANLPEVLLKYRIHPEQIGRVHSEEQAELIKSIQGKLRAAF